MNKTITIFDNRSNPKFGAKFNGSIEDSQTYEVVGYLDFLSPTLFIKKLDPEEKAKLLDLLVWAEKSEFPTYFSQLKNPITKEPRKNAFAVLQDQGGSVMTVTTSMNGIASDDVWLQAAGKKGRYIGYDKPQQTTAVKAA